MAAAKRMLQSVLPPLLWNAGKDLKRRLFRSVDHLECASRGWTDASLPPDSGSDVYWNSFLDYERRFVQALIPRVRAGDPILFPGRHDEPKHIYYAYVLALASRGRQQLTVLDYGGHLGAGYWLGKALVPGVELSYVCKELPAIAEAGREINDAVTWATDDECLARPYDLVLFSGSLQCVRDWRATLDRAAAATRGYLFLSDIPTVRHVASFVATHRSRGRTTLLHQFNRDELVGAVEAGGLRLVREFSPGEYPRVANAPEQPQYGAWLFERPR
jgi:putative methyltransferase (TIGR04325 family)